MWSRCLKRQLACLNRSVVAADRNPSLELLEPVEGIRPMQPYLLQFLLMTFAGWLNRKQQDAIEYLKEENRVLREQLGGRRLRFSNDHRRRLAEKAKALGREGLKEVAGLVTPDTLLRW